MPQENMTSKLGKSTSPAHQGAIDLQKNVQAPQSSTQAALNNAHNKHPKKGI